MPPTALPLPPDHLPQTLLPLLYQALASEHGIAISDPDPLTLRKRMYKVRLDAKDPELSCLSFRTRAECPDQLWIVKEGPKL